MSRRRVSRLPFVLGLLLAAGCTAGAAADFGNTTGLVDGPPNGATFQDGVQGTPSTFERPPATPVSTPAAVFVTGGTSTSGGSTDTDSGLKAFFDGG